jgi:hypothetical protein
VDSAFEQLKLAMITTWVLVLLNFVCPFYIETDACDTRMGAVLCQDEHPISYLARVWVSKINNYPCMDFFGCHDGYRKVEGLFGTREFCHCH